MPVRSNVGRRDGHVATSDVVIYTDEEFEFLKAVDKYKREKRRPFPTCSEILAIARALGYRKVA